MPKNCPHCGTKLNAVITSCSPIETPGKLTALYYAVIYEPCGHLDEPGAEERGN